MTDDGLSRSSFDGGLRISRSCSVVEGGGLHLNNYRKESTTRVGTLGLRVRTALLPLT